MRKLDGRIVELHFKDIENGVDKPWGTGKGDARAMLRELRRQRFRGLIDVEYEDGAGPALEANVARCIAFFDDTARELWAHPVELRIDPSISVSKNSYTSGFRRSDGGDVEVETKVLDDGSMTVHVASREERKTSGISLAIHVANDASGRPRAIVSSEWWTDVQTTDHAGRVEPSRGTSEPVGGEITLSSADFAHARPLYIRFEVDTDWQRSARVVSGGIVVTD